MTDSLYFCCTIFMSLLRIIPLISAYESFPVASKFNWSCLESDLTQFWGIIVTIAALGKSGSLGWSVALVTSDNEPSFFWPIHLYECQELSILYLISLMAMLNQTNIAGICQAMARRLLGAGTEHIYGLS